MGISIENREGYHPHFDADGNLVGGERDYETRLEIIDNVVDFENKRVLDLGCSGGFFTFRLSQVAKSVTGVDADKYIIKRNAEYAKRFDYRNVDFIQAEITAAFLAQQQDYDVVLCLSVLHHIIVGTSTYDWNVKGLDEPQRLLSALRSVGDVLVLEMGRTDEGFDWCHGLRTHIGAAEAWVRENVFREEFDVVHKLPGAAYQKWPFQRWPGLSRLPTGSRLGKRTLRLIGVDCRDFRSIYVGIKDSRSCR